MSGSWTLGLFVLITLLFGGAFPAIRAGVADVPPLLFAGTRYYLPGILLLAFALGTHRRLVLETRNDRLAIASGGFLLIGGTGLNFIGLQFTTSGVGPIIFATVPLFTVVTTGRCCRTTRRHGGASSAR